MGFTNNIQNSTYTIQDNTLIITVNNGWFFPYGIRNYAIKEVNGTNYITCISTTNERDTVWKYTIDSTKDYVSDTIFCMNKLNPNKFIYDSTALSACRCNIESGYTYTQVGLEITFTSKYKDWNFDKYPSTTSGAITLPCIYTWNTAQTSIVTQQLNKRVNSSGYAELYTTIQSGTANNYKGGMFVSRLIQADSASNTKVVITGSFTNCTCNYSNGEIVTDNSKPITITAIKGYEFLDEEYTIAVYMDNTFSYNLTATKNSENTILTFNLSELLLESNIELRINANTITPTKEKPKSVLSQWVRIYQPTNDELNSLASEVVSHDWLMAFYYLPFMIPQDFLSTDKRPIKIGKETAQTSAIEYLYWTVSISGGTITIPSIYNNVYDYINTDCEIHIPYIGQIKVNTNDVIGYSLTLTYNVNLYEGLITYSIVRNDNEYPIKQETKKIAYTVPIVSTFVGNNIIASNLSIPMIETNRNFTLKIVRNKPYIDNGFYGKQVKFYDRLKNLTGYIEVTEIQLDDTIPYENQVEIRQLLERGVFI